jgi:hypothetical protein
MSLPDRLGAARGGAAVGPVLRRGVLRVAGKDARDFLHRMSTQHLQRLAAGGSAYAAFLTARGHLVAEGVVLAREGDLLVVTEPEAAGPLAEHLRRYVVLDDVRVEDLSEELRAVPVLGPEGTARLGPRPEVTLAASPRRGAPALDALAPAPVAEALRREMLEGGAADLGEADLEALRIEAGIARFGADMDGERLPMEAGLTRDAIHFDKGCYIGQEVVLRASMRGHLQKGLVQLELPAGAGPGARLRAGGQDVGWVTSAADTSRGRLGLGYLRRAHWREGERLETDAGEAAVRRVVVHEPR